MADYDVNAKLDAYRQSMKKKEEILSQLQQGVVNTQAEIHMIQHMLLEPSRYFTNICIVVSLSASVIQHKSSHSW